MRRGTTTPTDGMVAAVWFRTVLAPRTTAPAAGTEVASPDASAPTWCTTAPATGRAEAVCDSTEVVWLSAGAAWSSTPAAGAAAPADDVTPAAAWPAVARMGIALEGTVETAVAAPLRGEPEGEAEVETGAGVAPLPTPPTSGIAAAGAPAGLGSAGGMEPSRDPATDVAAWTGAVGDGRPSAAAGPGRTQPSRIIAAAAAPRRTTRATAGCRRAATGGGQDPRPAGSGKEGRIVIMAPSRGCPPGRLRSAKCTQPGRGTNNSWEARHRSALTWAFVTAGSGRLARPGSRPTSACAGLGVLHPLRRAALAQGAICLLARPPAPRWRGRKAGKHAWTGRAQTPVVSCPCPSASPFASVSSVHGRLLSICCDRFLPAHGWAGSPIQRRRISAIA